ncbi:MAG: helix-turn-helix domain-containing protein [Bacteroidales bacterium]|jgi:hypothetical protein|nr:helix-turn-helix domain-containing protein [Bacteroidales bacterium]
MEIKLLTSDEFDSFKSKVFRDLDELKSMLNNRSNKPTWIKSSEVKRLLGISHSTLQNLRNNGTLEFSRINGIIYYQIANVEKILEQNKSTK